MVYLKWGFRLVVLAAVFAAFYYALPSKDNVRIVGTEVRLEDRTQTNDAGEEVTVKDDVFYIKAVEADGTPRVYRNEDNFWYFKFDSSNLDTAATNVVSTGDDPKWMIVTHYGWRITYLSVYPNAVSMRPADGPEESPFPWFNVIFLTALIIAVLVIRRVLIILRRRHVDPVVEAIDGELDETAGWWRRRWRALFGRK